MTEYNEWFNEVTEEEYDRFIKGLKQVKPKHLNFLSTDIKGGEWRLNGKLIAFSSYDFDESEIYCIINEDIVC